MISAKATRTSTRSSVPEFKHARAKQLALSLLVENILSHYYVACCCASYLRLGLWPEESANDVRDAAMAVFMEVKDLVVTRKLASIALRHRNLPFPYKGKSKLLAVRVAIVQDHWLCARCPGAPGYGIIFRDGTAGPLELWIKTL